MDAGTDAGRIALGVFFVLAGAMHFVRPRAYAKIVPPYLPAPRTLVYLSGAAEIAGGAGALSPASSASPARLRRLSGWALISLLAAVFPANLHMALHPEDVPKLNIPRWALWARLPLQPLMMWWVWRTLLRR